MNLSLCQECQLNPATYGDGLTWSRCSECQLKFTQAEPPQKIEPNIEGERFEHKTIPGKTSIIIPVYNTNYALFHYTGNCIGSVREHTDKQTTPYEIIVIDNGSPIKTPTMQSYYADKVVVHENNLGVTVAWNKGIRVAFGEYIVLLNNDTQVFDGWLEMMQRALNDGDLDLVMSHPMYSLTEPFARAVEARREKSRWDGKEIQASLSDFRDFSCVMFKKELIDKVGAFDERFFAYASDSDFLDRMDELGLKYASCKAVPIHHISDATGASLGETPEVMNEDKRRYAEKKQQQQLEVVGEVETIDMVHSGFEVDYLPDVEPTEIRFVRTVETGDKVYFLSNGQVHWVKNPEVLQKLGGTFDQVVEFTQELFARFEKGEPIDSFNVQKYATV